MQLASHTISSQPDRPQLLNVQFSSATPHRFEIEDAGSRRSAEGQHDHGDPDWLSNVFASPIPQGFLVAHDCPLNVVTRRGGGFAPRWAPNKVILWDQDAIVHEPAGHTSAQKHRQSDCESDDEKGLDLVNQKGSTIFDATSRFGDGSDPADWRSTHKSTLIDREGKAKAREQSQTSMQVPTNQVTEPFDRIREWQENQKATRPSSGSSSTLATSLSSMVSEGTRPAQHPSAPGSSSGPASSSSSRSDLESDPGVGRSIRSDREEEAVIEMIPDEELSEMSNSSASKSQVNRLNEGFALEKSDLAVAGLASDDDAGQPNFRQNSTTKDVLGSVINPSSVPLPVESTASLYSSVNEADQEFVGGSNFTSNRRQDPLSRSFSIESSSAGLDDPFSTADDDGVQDFGDVTENRAQRGFEGVQAVEAVSLSGIRDGELMKDSESLDFSLSIDSGKIHDGTKTSPRLEKLKSLKSHHSTNTRVVAPPKEIPTSERTARSAAPEEQAKDENPTTDFERTNSEKPRQRSGRSVAELEFGETVRGVCVRRFEWKEKIKTTTVVDEASSSEHENKGVDRTILASVLDSKVVVFELGRGVSRQAAQNEPAVGDGTWGIIQRAVVDIWDGKINADTSNGSHMGQSRDSGQQGRSVRSKLGSGLASISPMKTFGIRSSFKSASHNRITTTRGALLAILGRQVGHVQLVELPLLVSDLSSTTSFSSSKPSAYSNKGASTIIAAHSSSVISLTLSEDGSKLLTASERGTVLRIWSTGVGENQARPSSSSASFSTGAKAVLLSELRRGTDPARILSMKFSPDEKFVAVASDKGTIHFFRLTDQNVSSRSSDSTNSKPKPKDSSTFSSNTPPLFNSASKFLPSRINKFASSLHSSIPSNLLPTYFNSTWSECQFRIPLKTFLSERSSNSSADLFSASPSRSIVDSGKSPSLSDDLRQENEFFFRNNFSNNKTTEGSWANMRGRIKDLRRGEIGIDEKIWLNWCRNETHQVGVDPIPKSEPRDNKPAPLDSKDRASRDSSWKDANAQEDQDFHLIAITSSGGWYRVSVASADSGLAAGVGAKEPQKRSSSSSSGSVVKDMYKDKEDTSSTSSSSRKNSSDVRKERTRANGGCTLVEYRRIGELDGW